MQVHLTVNGKDTTVDVPPHTLLVQVLREQLKLTGTHVGCDTAQCGVCTVMKDGRSFGADPRGGPWASVMKHDAAFAAAFVAQNVERYKQLVIGMGRTLVDRDTAPGTEPEDMLRCDIPALVVPGNDAAHATSAARYLHECLPNSEYWDVAVADQTEANTPGRVLEFLAKADASAAGRGG